MYLQEFLKIPGSFLLPRAIACLGTGDSFRRRVDI
jgi:hypothetical protein